MSDPSTISGSTNPAERLVVDLLPMRLAVLPDEASLLLQHLAPLFACVFGGAEGGGSEGELTLEVATEEM